MHLRAASSFEDEICRIGYVPQFETEGPITEFVFFNDFELCVSLELQVAILVPKFGSTSLYASEF